MKFPGGKQHHRLPLVQRPGQCTAPVFEREPLVSSRNLNRKEEHDGKHISYA
jgi:hypothetical protein